MPTNNLTSIAPSRTLKKNPHPSKHWSLSPWTTFKISLSKRSSNLKHLPMRKLWWLWGWRFQNSRIRMESLNLTFRIYKRRSDKCRWRKMSWIRKTYSLKDRTEHTKIRFREWRLKGKLDNQKWWKYKFRWRCWLKNTKRPRFGRKRTRRSCLTYSKCK